MERIVLAAIALAASGLTSAAQETHFLPKHLAVLRAGDGQVDLHLKQAPVFIDQFASDRFNDSPSFTVKIATNGPETLFFNGHAATEGILTRSADHRLLAVAGYGGVSLLQSNGVPSQLDIDRGFCTVDAAGIVRTKMYKRHPGEQKMNPRGIVTDGTNNFWGCGNAFGTFYCNASEQDEPLEFASIPNSRALRIVNGMLYVTLNGPDANVSGLPAGILSFEDGHGNAAPLPQSGESTLKSLVAAVPSYSKIAGFDLDPAGTMAYTADTMAGIQKYVKTNSAWKFAYNFSIPQTIDKEKNHATGCFGLVVDFSGKAPVIYATTTEGYGGCVNSNRVVRIVDTNATATVTTLAQAPSASMAYRGIEFTPEKLSLNTASK